MRVRVALGMAASAVVISMASIGFAATNNAKRVEDVSRLGKQNQSFLTTIQNERVANIRRSCEDVNDRNTEITKVFNRLIRETGQKQTAKQKHQVKEFVDAGWPRRNCNKVVKQQAGKSQAKR